MIGCDTAPVEGGRTAFDLKDEDTRVLSRLIDDLRTLALSETGALQLRTEPANIVDLVRDAVRSMQAEAARKSVSLALAAPPDEVVLDIDPLRIRKVLNNLLSNAIRHTREGRAVTVSIADSAETITITVEDTGEGMPPDDVARMFDRFYKGSTSEGSGLGLAIVKGIITAHGGEISATSRIERGTAVTFTLPRRTP